MRLRLSVPAAVAMLVGSALPARAQVSVGGVVYAQYSYNTANDTLKADSTVGHVNNFDITRAYVNVLGRFSGGIVTRVTADITNSAGSRLYRLKYAYVNWTPEGSPLTWRFGLIHTPWLDYEESLWDYRMEGPMALDRGGYMSSADFGAAVEGSLKHDAVNFLGGVYDGENYSGGPADTHKDVMGRVTVRLVNSDDMSRLGGLRLTGYAGYGIPSSGGERQRYIGMISWRSSTLTLAAEVASTKDSVTGGNTTVGGGAVTAKPEAKGTVLSLFGVAHLPGSKLALIGRFDSVDPSSAVASDKYTRLIAGLSYQLSPNVRLLGDVDTQSFESGYAPTTTNYAAYVGRSTINLHTQFTF